MSRSKGAGPTWTTKDGRELPIRRMDDSHLVNTALFLERTFPMALAAAEAALDSEWMIGLDPESVAYEIASGESERLADADSPSDLWPVYDDIIEEIYRRKSATALYESRKRL